MHDILSAPIGRNSEHVGNSVTQIRDRLGDTEKTVTGRDGWALHALIECGPRGVTPIDNPAPRWSHYVFKLRGGGFDIATIDEPHGGAFAGSHARYVLRSPVTVLSVTRKLERVAA
jgi:hypothetical protein